MAYHAEKVSRAHLGIRPTADDHKFVKTMSLMGIPTRKICVMIGERMNLGKAMSMQSLYYHFRRDLVGHKRGRKPSGTLLKRRWESDMVKNMQSMIGQLKRRNKYGF